MKPEGRLQKEMESAQAGLCFSCLRGVQLQPVQFAAPLPAVCLQSVTLVQVLKHELAALQACCVFVALLPVSSQLPPLQCCVHVAPAPQVTWHPSVPAQFTVQFEPVHVAWQPPVDGQFNVQFPVVHEHCWFAMQVMGPEVPPPPPVPESFPEGGAPHANSEPTKATTTRQRFMVMLPG